MNKKIVLIVIVIIICVALGIMLSIYNKKEVVVEENNVDDEVIVNDTTEIVFEDSKEREEPMNTKIKVIINNTSYKAVLESNNTAQEFMNMLPQEFSMSELNGNEKYCYLSNNLTSNSYNPGRIEAGDIMLFGNNCIVVFYKSFNTSYSYTKIGHIENLPDLGGDNIIVRFEK